MWFGPPNGCQKTGTGRSSPTFIIDNGFFVRCFNFVALSARWRISIHFLDLLPQVGADFHLSHVVHILCGHLHLACSGETVDGARLEESLLDPDTTLFLNGKRVGAGQAHPVKTRDGLHPVPSRHGNICPAILHRGMRSTEGCQRRSEFDS